MESKEYNMQEWYCHDCYMMHITQHMGTDNAHCPQCHKEMELSCELNARRDCYPNHVEWHLTERVE